jgi:hypothetical protein
MNDYTKQERCFTTSQCARLLGLSVRELQQLERLGVGPDYEGTLPYISYRLKKIEQWAFQHVHAPIPWFDRFDEETLDRVKRCRLATNGKYFKLRRSCESRMLRIEARCCTTDVGSKGVCRLYRDDSPAFNTSLDIHAAQALITFVN